MGIITLEKVDYLFWLGRYTERVYTTIKLYKNDYDTMIDSFSDSYITFCKRFQIPNIYKDKDDFIQRYAFDRDNPDSLISNITRAYDNAVYLRDEIGSETLSYIQMAIYDMQAAEISPSPIIRIQQVIDNILAFWGCIDDQVDDDKIRSIIKLGKRVERLDLYLRLRQPQPSLKREAKRLTYRLAKTGLPYNVDEVDLIHMELEKPSPIDYKQTLKHLENVFNV
ncbi:MAG: alpha-E domain-containing protein [bacterium]|nr:alpha-E domain-containing protein [bacterium]